jgi:hypothetical protein
MKNQHWKYFVFSMGDFRHQASTCKSCKGTCYVWALMRLPRRWNPEFKWKLTNRDRWVPHRVPKFKRLREDAKHYLDRSKYRA